MTRVVGIDENGLGPQLGPLVTTGVLVEFEGGYDASVWRRVGSDVGVVDSKKCSGFSKMRWAESVALAAYERLEHRTKTEEQLLESVLTEPPSEIRQRCPNHVSQEQCWAASLTLPVFGGDAREGHRVLDTLESRGVRVLWTMSSVACVHRLHDEAQRGYNRLRVNLACFEELMMRATLFAPDVIIAGMVGGIRNYPKFFRYVSPPRNVVEESRGRCVYDVPRLGRLRFEVNADDEHLPVALASMLGKYLRELWMQRLHRFYLSHMPHVEPVSGYHDPRTTAFVRESELLRTQLGVSHHCFAR